MQTSESISNITKALVKFQSEAKGIVKDSQGHNYKYISLDQILALVRPVLAKNGLVMIQDAQGFFMEGENVAGCITRIIHESGEWIGTEQLLIKPSPTKQGMATGPRDLGSAITYAKRYQLTAILGLSADVDDDAGAVSDNLKSWGQKINAAQATLIGTLMNEKKVDKNRMLTLIPEIIGVAKNSKELTSEEADKVIAHLQGLQSA